MLRLIRHTLNRRSQDCTCVPGRNAHYSTVHCKIARVCYLPSTERNEYPSSISLACHERENLRENEEAGFHAQMHSLCVNKYVNGIRLVDTKCFFENIWKSCTTIPSRCEQTRSSGIKKNAENKTSLRTSEILIYILHVSHLQTMRSSKICDSSKILNFSRSIMIIRL